MSDSDSSQEVTVWLNRLRLNDSAAAQELWRHYFSRLVRLARHRLGGRALRSVDEEDIALDVFHDFAQGVAAGRFAALQDRRDIWRLMASMIGCKVIDEIRERNAQKRGGGEVRGESVFINRNSPSDQQPGLEGMPLEAPGPEALAAAVDEFDRLYAVLPDEAARRLVAMKMEGYTNEEISKAWGVSIRTVERKLAQVREIWSQ